MKLAITVLSSILAVCSITVANPVLTTATTSTESSTSTVIPSSTTSAESTLIPIFDPKKVNCDPFSLNEVIMIQTYARDKMIAERMAERFKRIELDIETRRQLIIRLRKHLATLKSNSWENNGASNYGTMVEDLENEISRQITVYRSLKLQFDSLILQHYNMHYRWQSSGLALVNRMVRYDTNVVLTGRNVTLLNHVPGFTECIKQVNTVLLKLLPEPANNESSPEPEETRSNENVNVQDLADFEDDEDPPNSDSDQENPFKSNEDQAMKPEFDGFGDFEYGPDDYNDDFDDNGEGFDEYEEEEDENEQQASDSQQQDSDAQQ
ncbi:hypothetical protein BDEG_28757 [Batrachochytrium dendrobatidis JEL423]|uniref:Uncharacterized protein n=1 Tax=Batrachochytrium dendrobatidis (strain JEL423) TaxID=403673 RepID=A0A177W0E3_BATDL|nr:hypothetical protein BDEG_28757 [Batrachochytrium dendrobatidis JEL423]